METRSSKKQKLHNNLNNSFINNGHDRITDLPDAVIHHILILLPLKSVVQTSVLSKRWLDIWYTFPDLDFTTINYHKSSSLANNNYITNILSLRDKLSYLRVLRFYANITFSNLHLLIRNAVRLRVQELDINVKTNDIFNFPRSITSHDSLKFLKVTANPGFRLPPSKTMRFGFPTLQILSLSVVYLGKQSSLLDMFTDCLFPQLKKLYLNFFNDLIHLRVTCRLLEELVIQNCSLLQGLEIFCPRLVTLKVLKCFTNDFNTWVHIDTPKLDTIVWTNNSIASENCVENLNSLHDFTFGNLVTQENIDANELQRLSSFLSGLSHTECLTLESPFVEMMLKNNYLAEIMFRPFLKLKSLELHTQRVAGLANVLKLCPTIHTLVIIKVTSSYKPERRWNRHSWDLHINFNNEEQLWESHANDLKLLLHYHLKIVKIEGISDYQDMNLVKFLLKHGKALQEIVLCLRDNNSRSYHRHGKFKSCIMEFPRASRDVNLEFG